MPDSAYAKLLSLRTGLRHFEAWSAQQARAAGLTPTQHQLLLTIRGHGDPEGPTIGEAADYLLLRHHSTVGLVDRAEAAGLVQRVRSRDDHRVVRLRLTRDGEARLEALSALHLEELERLALDVPSTSAGLGPVQRVHGFPGPPEGEREKNGKVTVARVSDPPDDKEVGVLVDRLWPRSIPRDAAPWAKWAKDIAPSAELLRWYGHAPERFDEFQRRYQKELSQEPGNVALRDLRAEARRLPLVLLTAAKDLEHCPAAVLRDALVND